MVANMGRLEEKLRTHIPTFQGFDIYNTPQDTNILYFGLNDTQFITNRGTFLHFNETNSKIHVDILNMFRDSKEIISTYKKYLKIFTEELLEPVRAHSRYKKIRDELLASV